MSSPSNIAREEETDVPANFTYLVTIEAESLEQADRVISERIGYDEDYGFDYTIDFTYIHKSIHKDGATDA